MSRRGLVLLLLLLPAVASGLTFSSGAAAGVEANDRAPWVRWEALEASPVHAFRLDASVPPGSFIIDWQAFEPSWTGLGWELREDQAATSVTSAFGTPGAVAAAWAGTVFDLQLSTPWFLAVAHRGGGWNAGGAAAGTGGTLRNREPFDLGPFVGRGWTAWAGSDTWTGFYGEASAEVSASRNLLLWSFEGQGQAEARWAGVATEGLWPLWWFTWAWQAAAGYAEGRLQADMGRNLLGQGQWKTSEESRARGIAGWLDQNWHSGAWSLGLGTGAAVFWVENPTWTQSHTWTETQFPWWPLPFPVVTVERSSTTDYTFEASPGWVVVLHPQVTWRPAPPFALTVSRWVPFSGGIRLALDASPAAAPTDSGAAGAPSISTRNLWLAGTQVEFSASW